MFAGALLGFALYLGPDSFLAPLGIESRIQPGRSTSLAFGRLFNSSSEFVVDAEEGFRAEPTTSIVAANVALYFGAGIGAYRVLLSTFDDPGFVCALAACAGIAGTVYEILRPKRPTREEAQANDLLQSSFEDFASNRIQYAPQGAVHKTEVVAAFRRSVARYRTASASGVSDPVVEKIVRYWFRNQAGISMTPAGFYRGCVLKKPE